jgi:hypothetical protein
VDALLDKAKGLWNIGGIEVPLFGAVVALTHRR